MQLTHSEIPLEFLSSLPEGMKFIHRHGKGYMVVEEVLCPNGHSLIADSVRIHDEPSIKLHLTVARESGIIFIDAFWGSHAKLYNFVPKVTTDDALASATCPVCDVSLNAPYDCHEPGCGSHEGIKLHLPGGQGTIGVCARHGCPGHRLEVHGAPARLIETVSAINFFGEGGDDFAAF